MLPREACSLPAPADPTSRPPLGSPAGPGLWLQTSTSGDILFITLIIIIIIINNGHLLDAIKYFSHKSSFHPLKKPTRVDVNLPICQGEKGGS